LLQDKKVAAEAKKALKKHEQTHRRETKEARRRATLEKQLVGSEGTHQMTSVTIDNKSVTRRSLRPQILKTSHLSSDATPKLPETINKVAQLKTFTKQTSEQPLRDESVKNKEVKGKDMIRIEVDADLDSSTQAEPPNHLETNMVAAQPITMVPSVDMNDGSPKDGPSQQLPLLHRKNDIQKQYMAALHQRPAAAAKPKVTYTSMNKSIKRKSVEDIPEHSRPAPRVQVDELQTIDGQTTYENLRQVSFGLRLRKRNNEATAM
jgi:hypothetical protein